MWLQLPIAVAITLGLFAVWMLLLRFPRGARLQPRTPNELGACLLLSLLWGILLLAPIHYAIQGYFTSIGNFIALAFYQLPVNALALFGWTALTNPGLPRDGTT